MRITENRGRPWRSGQRLGGGGLVAVTMLLLVGCGGTVSGNAVTGTTPSRASTSAAQPELILDIEFREESAALSDADLVASISAVLGDVDELSSASSVGPDAYVGMADGRYRVWFALPDATAKQLAVARRAVVGARRFALRPVTGSTVDERACATLQASPKSDQLCDPDTREVLTLGKELVVVPTRVEKATAQASQSAATVTFSAADAKTLASFTAAHVGDRLAVTDGLVLLTAPTIQSPITTGSLSIGGNHSSAEAAALVGKLQLAAAGATISSPS